MEQIFLLIASLALIALTVVWIFAPLLRGAPAAAERSPEQRALAELSLQHDITLTSLRDLDADYSAGKLNQDDYAAQRASLLAEGVEVLQKIDALKTQLVQAHPALDAAIEAEVRARRVTPALAVEGATCPTCGATVRPTARFCDQCGAVLQPATVQPANSAGS